MKRLALGAVVMLALLPACGGTDRPEGVVERWLISLNQGPAGRPGRYAPEQLSRSILSDWERCDPGALELTEVGRGREFTTNRPAVGTTAAAVPYHVEYTTGLDRSCDDPAAQHAPTGGIALLDRKDGTWRIRKLSSAPRGGGPSEFAGLRVPSEGGERIGGATLGQWLAGVGVGVALALIVVVLMSIAPGPLPRSE
jgi:hypothetical protein